MHKHSSKHRQIGSIFWPFFGRFLVVLTTFCACFFKVYVCSFRLNVFLIVILQLDVVLSGYIGWLGYFWPFLTLLILFWPKKGQKGSKGVILEAWCSPTPETPMYELCFCLVFWPPHIILATQNTSTTAVETGIKSGPQGGGYVKYPMWRIGKLRSAYLCQKDMKFGVWSMFFG